MIPREEDFDVYVSEAYLPRGRLADGDDRCAIRSKGPPPGGARRG